MKTFLVTFSLFALILVSCNKKPLKSLATNNVLNAKTTLRSTLTNEVIGTVNFQAKGRKVFIKAHIKGLEPNSIHGFHIHEYGSCEMEGKKAGGHFAPQAQKHGAPDESASHAGDLGNITADDNGEATYSATFDKISLYGVEDFVIGRAVILHKAKDDFETQPSGNAKRRIGCGIIGVVE